MDRDHEGRKSGTHLLRTIHCYSVITMHEQPLQFRHIVQTSLDDEIVGRAHETQVELFHARARLRELHQRLFVNLVY